MQTANLPALNVASPMTLAPAVPYLPLSYIHPGLSFSQIMAILKAWRWQSVWIGLLVASLIMGLGMIMPRSYESTATLMIDFEVNDPLGSRQFPIGLLGSYMATQTDLIQSPGVLLALVDRLNLTQDSHYTKGFDQSRSGDVRDWVAQRVSKNLTVVQGRNASQLVYVTYAGREADEAAEIANAIVDIYLKQSQARSAIPATAYAQRYADQLDDLRAKVAVAQQRVSAFRERTQLIEAGGNIDVEMGRLQTLEHRLLEAEQARRDAEVRATENPSSAAPALSSSLVQTLKTQLAGQIAKKADLETILGSRHPDIIALNAQVRATSQSLAAAVNSFADQARLTLKSTRRIEEKLERATAAQRVRVLQIRELRDQADALHLELESAQKVYRQALDGYDKVMLGAAGHYSNMSVVSSAIPPYRASKPNLIKFLLLAMILGLGAGIGIPLIYELLRRRVRCRDDLERDHGIPVLIELGPLNPMTSMNPVRSNP